MEDKNIFNSKVVKQIVRSTFLIIGMFVVLSFGFATLVLFYGSKAIGDKLILCCILIGLPIIVFIGFFLVVKYIYNKLRWFSIVKDAVGFVEINIKDSKRVGKVGVTKCVLYSLNGEKLRPGQFEVSELEMVESNSGESRTYVPKAQYTENGHLGQPGTFESKHVLWIGGRYDGSINCEKVATTNEALKLLNNNNNNYYIAIVYDLECNDHNEEKKTFLNEIEKMNIKIPIFEANQSNV